MENLQKTADPLREKSFQLAIRIVKLYQYLTSDKKEFVLSKQLLKSGTNPGAMVREADDAESGNDFVHKLSVAQKETSETQYWLDLLFATDYLTEKEHQSISLDTAEIGKMLTSSIRTKKKNMAAKTAAIVLILTLATFFLFQ